MFDTIKNQIICFFIHHTYLDAGVCYAVARKIPKDEMIHYYEIMEEKD